MKNSGAEADKIKNIENEAWLNFEKYIGNSVASIRLSNFFENLDSNSIMIIKFESRWFVVVCFLFA